MTKIAILVCPNGLGHYKRVASLVSCLIDYSECGEFVIYCAQIQFDALKDDQVFKKFYQSKKVKFVFNLLNLAPQWVLDEKELENLNLNDWINSIKNEETILKADLVLSDNLVGILKVRPDALLMGSFLWSEVLFKRFPNHLKVKEFFKKENELLLKTHPPMLAVKSLATEGVLTKTKAVLLPWMCDDLKILKNVQKKEKNKFTIVTSFGKTQIGKKIEEEFLEKIFKINFNFDIDLKISNEAYKKFFPLSKSKTIDLSIMHYRLEDFLNAELLIGRPGAGLIHDGVRYHLPFLCIYEPQNFEMKHNAQVIHDFQIGFDLGLSLDFQLNQEKLLKIIFEMKDSQKRAKIEARIAGQKKNGIERACDWILKSRILK